MKILYCLSVSLIAIGASASPTLAGPRQDRAAAAGTTWIVCVVDRAERYATQPESAGVLVTAAFGNCVAEENTFRNLMRESTREHGLPFGRTASADELDAAFAQIKEQVEAKAVASLIDRRAATP